MKEVKKEFIECHKTQAVQLVQMISLLFYRMNCVAKNIRNTHSFFIYQLTQLNRGNLIDFK